MTTLTAIACSHGLGHIRRVAAVIRWLLAASDDIEVRLHGRRSHWETLSDWEVARELARDPRVTFVHLDTHTSLEFLLDRDARAPEWPHRLPDLEGAAVWCDNLPEILSVAPSAILSGSFFWHEVVSAEDAGHPYVGEARRLIAEHQPVVVGTGLFSTPEVVSCANFVPVSLYRYYTARPSSKTDLYLASGSGSWGAELDALVQGLAAMSAPPHPFERVWVERSRIPDGAAGWLRTSGFDAETFSSVLVGCVRPALGIVSDLLVSGARVHAIEERNFEMIHNSSRLTQLGVGTGFADIGTAFEAACDYARDENARREHEKAIADLRFDGVAETGRALLEHVGQAG